MKTITFRRKILWSYAGFFLILAVILYPVIFYLTKEVTGKYNVLELTSSFTQTYFIFSLLLLLISGLFALFVVNRLTRPIKEIIEVIKENENPPFFEISVEKGVERKDEFGLLAETLNSLSQRIQNEITTLLEERNEKSAILESLGEGVIAVDNQMKVTYINHVAETFLNINKQALIGKNFAIANQKECLALVQEATKGVLTRSIVVNERKPKKYLDIIACPRKDKGVILVVQDKTSLHKVVERGRDFIANASHELKTPITIIRGFAETLFDHPELTREVSLEILQKILNNCHRMDVLIKNLLTLAALDEGIPSSRVYDCDLADLAERAKQTIMAIHPQANITIYEKTKKLHLLADCDLLFQAFLNLLDNACKYSPHPAEITITIEKKQNTTTIAFADKGIGIAAEELDRIFERFYAVDKSHSRSLGGSGLGLSIVESIVEKHKGRIEVQSEPGVGTTFTLLFHH